jgi:hypothetical protein
MPTEGKSRLGPFAYVSLAVSVLLNVSGIASIVDDVVVWAGFIRDFIDLYRDWIREPILWALHLAWPDASETAHEKGLASTMAAAVIFILLGPLVPLGFALFVALSRRRSRSTTVCPISIGSFSSQ